MGVGAAGKVFFTELERRCRELSEAAAANGDSLLSGFWRVLAGLFWGIACGYISHLALDGTTPMGIPF